MRRKPRRLAVTTSLAVVLSGLAWVASAPATAAAFTAGDLVVVRVGSGDAASGSAATAAFLDEYGPDGALVQSVPLPVTLSQSAGSEGALARSADGRFLTLAGYLAAPGTGAVSSTTSAAVPRVAVRVDGAGAVDASTALTDAFSGGSVRGAVTDDGSRFWAVGASDGVRAAALGATGSTRLHTAAPQNLRGAAISGGNLYVSTGSSPAGIHQVGTGLPVTAGQTLSQLAPAPGPYGLVLLDRDPAVPGPDTAYLADESSAPNGGILKFSSDGTAWTARGSFRPGGAAVRQLTGEVRADGSVRLLATTTASLANAVVQVVDAAASATDLAATATTLATAPANTVFRGVALAPAGGGSSAVAPTIGTQPAGRTVAPGGSATLTVAASGTAPLGYQWFAGPAGDTGTPVGTDAPSFTTPALEAAASYWVRVSNAAGSVDSAAATVLVALPCTTAPVTIGSVQGTTDVSAGAGQTVTVRGTVVGDEEGPSPGAAWLLPAGRRRRRPGQLRRRLRLQRQRRQRRAWARSSRSPGRSPSSRGRPSSARPRAASRPAGQATVTPTDVTLPLATADALERYEGMLVRFHQTLTVTEHFQLGRFGQVVVSSGGRLPAADRAVPGERSPGRGAAGGEQPQPRHRRRRPAEPEPGPDRLRPGRAAAQRREHAARRRHRHRSGRRADVHLGRQRGQRQRLPAAAARVARRQRASSSRPTRGRSAAPVVGGTVKVASANLLNLFNTFGTTACSFGVGGAAADCRGAADGTEFERQLAKEVAALTALDADVVGAMEIENDGYGPASAVQTLVDRAERGARARAAGPSSTPTRPPGRRTPPAPTRSSPCCCTGRAGSPRCRARPSRNRRRGVDLRADPGGADLHRPHRCDVHRGRQPLQVQGQLPGRGLRPTGRSEPRHRRAGLLERPAHRAGQGTGPVPAR